MGLFKTFATDKKTETEGKWFPFSPNDDGSIPRFKLARLGATNPRYQAAMEQIARQYATEIALDLMGSKASEAILRKAFIETVLVGWENVQQESGEVIPYSAENAEALFVALPELYQLLRDKAEKLSNFRAAAVDSASE